MKFRRCWVKPLPPPAAIQKMLRPKSATSIARRVNTKYRRTDKHAASNTNTTELYFDVSLAKRCILMRTKPRKGWWLVVLARHMSFLSQYLTRNTPLKTVLCAQPDRHFYALALIVLKQDSYSSGKNNIDACYDKSTGERFR